MASFRKTSFDLLPCLLGSVMFGSLLEQLFSLGWFVESIFHFFHEMIRRLIRFALVVHEALL